MAEPLEKFAAESKLFDMNCTAQLAVDEVIVGAPALSFAPALTGPEALVLGAAVINGMAVEYPDGEVAPVGKAMQFRVSGGSVPEGAGYRDYSVIATFMTSAGNTLVARGALRVVAI